MMRNGMGIMGMTTVETNAIRTAYEVIRNLEATLKQCGLDGIEKSNTGEYIETDELNRVAGILDGLTETMSTWNGVLLKKDEGFQHNYEDEDEDELEDEEEEENNYKPNNGLENWDDDDDDYDDEDEDDEEEEEEDEYEDEDDEDEDEPDEDIESLIREFVKKYHL